MRRSVVAIVILSVCINACARSANPKPAPTNSSAEQEIRAALCDLDKHDYASAQKRLERVLQSDPKNIYARKVLLGSLAEQIKPGEKSPENTALIKKAIEGYSQAMNDSQFAAEEQRQIGSYLVSLYQQLGEEELKNELQGRASDSRLTAKDRAEAYKVLASKSWDCSYRITSTKSPLEKSEIERARVCVASGLSYANQAIALDGENESAWSYQANLLREGAKLAGFESNQTQRASYQRQSDEAAKRANELSVKRQAETEKEWARHDEERKKNDSFTPKEAAAFSNELVDYKRENSLDDVVKRVFMPIKTELTTLVAPVPIPEEKTEGTSMTVSKPSQKGCFRAADGTAQVQEKRDWKTFAPADEDITVDLPDNVCRSAGGYLAASEGVMYSIASVARPATPLGPTVVDGVLNTLARTFVGMRSGGWLGDAPGNSFELKLLRKEDVNGQPRKSYAYTRVSCSERKESMLIVHASQAHYYTIDISGANESDERVQRFLKSVKFK